MLFLRKKRLIKNITAKYPLFLMCFLLSAFLQMVESSILQPTCDAVLISMIA